MRNMKLIIHVHVTDDQFIVMDCTGDTTPFLTSRIVEPYSPDEHPEFNECVGNELYKYINDMMRRDRPYAY